MSPSPRRSFCATERIASPPDAQAFSTASIGLAAIPGTIATRPASSPCSFSVKLQVAPIEATSNADGSAPIEAAVSVTARETISGTVIPISFPNFDWW